MKNASIVFLGKSLSFVSKSLNKGNGSTWPGHIALKINGEFIEDTLKKSKAKVILIAGTNGKTTTARIIRTILEGKNHMVIHNDSGANLLSGIASTLLLKSTPSGKLRADYIVLEVDENALPQVLGKITPDYLIILNLFRDQLDRYGEVDSIASNWRESIATLSSKTNLILNADDPQVAYLSDKTKASLHFFGLKKRSAGNTSMHAADSLYCPRCGNKLSYNYKLYSHLGDWFCRKCELARPSITHVTVPYFPLSGVYNDYNTTAACLLMHLLSIPPEQIEKGLKDSTPAFGRQEIIHIKDKTIQLFLSKNPTGFNESLRTVADKNAKHLLLVLNDNIADGKDVSWIWDIDFESFMQRFTSITVSGTRARDMGLRMKYAGLTDDMYSVEEDIPKALHKAMSTTTNTDTLYILPTYTAMLEVRKTLGGKSIL